MKHNQLIYTLNFAEIGMKDVARVGGKNASLGSDTKTSRGMMRVCNES